MSYPLQSVEVGPTGTSYGTPHGWATVAYDPSARTITVTLTATGLTPGAHAAHIHIGSCMSQGPVQYTVGSGSSAAMHGFTWTPQHGFRTVDDPHGAGTTTVNGVNDHGQLVGFYVDGNGNTDGFLASPLH